MSEVPRTALQVRGEVHHVRHTQTAPQLFELGVNRPHLLAADRVPKYMLDRTVALATQHQHLAVFNRLGVGKLFDGLARLGIRLFELCHTHTRRRRLGVQRRGVVVLFA